MLLLLLFYQYTCTCIQGIFLTDHFLSRSQILTLLGQRDDVAGVAAWPFTDVIDCADPELVGAGGQKAAHCELIQVGLYGIIGYDPPLTVQQLCAWKEERTYIFSNLWTAHIHHR